MSSHSTPEQSDLNNKQASTPKSGRPYIRLLLGSLTMAALLYLIFRSIDGAQLKKMLLQLDPKLCLWAFGVYMGMYGVRSARFALLVPKASFGTMLSIVAVHNFMLRLMPMRTGEFVYAYLVKRAGATGMTEGLLGVVLVRLLDATVVLLFFGTTLAFNRGSYLGDPELGLIVAGALALVGIIALIFYKHSLRLGIWTLGRMLAVLKLNRRPSVARTFDKLSEAIEEFSRLPLRVTLLAIVYTVVGWILNFAMIWLILAACGPWLSVSRLVLGGTGSIVGSMLPVSAVGNFGALEATWALGFSLVGVSTQLAAASGIAFSMITLGFAALVAPVGWVAIVRKHPSK
jgi:uncharacterized protein (TIRG00374 family)